MFDQLRQQVLEANLDLVRGGLVLQTFGNASAISRADGVVIIKPSGVAYDQLRPSDMVLTDLEGRVLEGKLRPSVDLATHLVLYKVFPEIGAVVHTHSEFATVWAQAGRQIPPLGTTHADYFAGSIPVTRSLTEAEIQGDYVGNTGAVIAECFSGLDPLAIPAALVDGHGPFCWGRTAADAVRHALVLEAVARMALHTLLLRPETTGISQTLLDRHYVRKHGSAASYGQGVE